MNILNDDYLVGDEGLVPTTANQKIENLRKIIYFNPPDTHKLPVIKARELFENWLISPSGKNWANLWNFFQNLDSDDFIYLYSTLPRPLIKQDSTDGDVTFYLDHVERSYVATGCWLLWFSNSGRKKPQELKEEAFKKYKLRAQTTEAFRTLCQQVIETSEFSHWAGYFNHNPSMLWFFSEVNLLLHNLEEAGFFNPLTVKDIKDSTECYQWTCETLHQMLNPTSVKDGRHINCFGDAYRYLWVEVMDIAKSVAEKDVNFRDAYFEPFIKLALKENRYTHRTRGWGFPQYYKSESEINLFKQRPREKRPKNRKEPKINC